MLHDILILLVGILLGAVIGFFGARTFMKKYLKKNPPINEEMIKALMMQMGRKPNQKQINQMMKAMEKYQIFFFRIKKYKEMYIVKEIDKIAFIYLKDGKILSTLSKGKDTYYIPGGKREKAETDEETLIRECKEELTIDILKDTIKYYGTFKAQAHGHAEGIIVKMTCYMAEFKGTLKPSSEIAEIKWLDYSNLNVKISPVDQLIFKDLYNKNLID